MRDDLRPEEELSGIYKRHVNMVYRLCWMYLKTKRMRRTPSSRFL